MIELRSSIKCCKDCTERHELCHSHCEKYKSEKAEWEIQKAEMRKKQEVEQNVTGDLIKHMLKNTGKKRRQL